jgi:hypothetical protein
MKTLDTEKNETRTRRKVVYTENNGERDNRKTKKGNKSINKVPADKPIGTAETINKCDDGMLLEELTNLI